MLWKLGNRGVSVGVCCWQGQSKHIQKKKKKDKKKTLEVYWFPRWDIIIKGDPGGELWLLSTWWTSPNEKISPTRCWAFPALAWPLHSHWTQLWSAETPRCGTSLPNNSFTEPRHSRQSRAWLLFALFHFGPASGVGPSPGMSCSGPDFKIRPGEAAAALKWLHGSRLHLVLLHCLPPAGKCAQCLLFLSWAFALFLRIIVRYCCNML